MSKLEKIVPSLRLCKKIPEGEFKDSALVWMHRPALEGISDDPFMVDYRIKAEYLKREIHPAPTLEETITSLLTYGWLVKIDCRIQLDTLIEFYSEKQSKTEFGNTASETALRIWLKLKGVEVE